MLIAQNQRGELIFANKKLSKNKLYYCPACKQRVHLKIGEVISTHFAHFQNEACDVFSEGETEEHILGKLKLTKRLKNIQKYNKSIFSVKVEAYLPKLQQRPDILVQSEQGKYAIEFQCSPISIRKIKERTKGYLKNNYQVIWILGKNFEYKKYLTSFHKSCLYFDNKSQNLFLFHYDTVKDQIVMRRDFYLNHKNKLNFKTKRFNHDEKVILHDSKKNIQLFKNSETELIAKHTDLMKSLNCSRKNTQRFYQLLYEHQENFVSIPIELYYTVPSEWIIQTFSFQWKYRFIIWLESLPSYRIITKKYLLRWLERELKEQNIAYYIIPQLPIQNILNPFYEFIEILVNKGMVQKIGIKQWKVKCKLKRYKNLEEKYYSFKIN